MLPFVTTAIALFGESGLVTCSHTVAPKESHDAR